MKLLIDTHVFIWFINGDEKLPNKIKYLIEDIDNECFLSIASLWEIAIKLDLGKLSINSEFNQISGFLAHNDIELLPITFEHLKVLLNQESHHRDPFDRVIISQSISGNFQLISKDTSFSLYPVDLIWN